MAGERDGFRPLSKLDEADQEFVVRLVLASGSLKELARLYGVSYPTIRARLDKVINRLEEIQKGRPRDPLAELLAELVDRGELTVPAARRILELDRTRREREATDGTSLD